MPTRLRTESAPLSTHDCLPSPTRNFLGNRFVYCVLSERAGGLSIGINMNPDKRCNFDCVYCEVDRGHDAGSSRVKTTVMLSELERLLALVHAGRLGELGYHPASPEMLPFKEVAFSGDGEPTLCPNFQEVVEAVIHLRSRRKFPFFKVVLITNATGLHLPEVRAGVALFTAVDEIWAKLDAGTQEHMDTVNRSGVSLELVLRNIRDLAHQRPVIIQSLFPAIDGAGPSDQEILAYAERLRELREAGAKIPLVQVYSAHRPAMDALCAHLPLRELSKIARTVRDVSGLPAEVF